LRENNGASMAHKMLVKLTRRRGIGGKCYFANIDPFQFVFNTERRHQQRRRRRQKWSRRKKYKSAKVFFEGRLSRFHLYLTLENS
jgi:hypothetical protein